MAAVPIRPIRLLTLLVTSMLLVACHHVDGVSARDDASPHTRSSAPTPPVSAPASPSPTATGRGFSRVMGSAPTPIRVGTHLPTGAPPRVQYVAQLGQAQVVVLPGGRVAATLEDRPHGDEGYRHLSFAPFAGGWLAGFDDMGLNAVLMRPNGAMGTNIGQGPWEVFSRPNRREIVFSYAPWSHTADQSVVATLGPSGLRRLGPAQSTAGFLNAHVVVITTGAGVFRVDTLDKSRTRVPGIGSASMVSSRSGLLIGSAAGDNGLDKHGVYDARTGRPVLGSPSYALLGFSPSGRFVVGYRGGPATGGGAPSVVIVADVETGDIVRAFRLRLYDTGIPVWEDEQTFLMEFVRLGLDGTVERPRLLDSRASSCCDLLPAPVS